MTHMTYWLCAILVGALLFVWMMLDSFTFDIRHAEFQKKWRVRMDEVMAKDSSEWTRADRDIVNGRIPWSWKHPFDWKVGAGTRSSMTWTRKH